MQSLAHFGVFPLQQPITWLDLYCINGEISGSKNIMQYIILGFFPDYSYIIVHVNLFVELRN